jgi:acetyl esterase
VQLLHHAGVKVKYKNYQHQAHGFINLTSISAQAKKDLVEIGQTFYKFLKTVI